jgi:uncharacterized protein (TIGR02231 family)
MRLLITLLLAAFHPFAYGQKTINIPSTLEQATVFAQGAQVQRTARASLPAGGSTLVFTGLATSLDPQSVQLKAGGNFTLLSVAHRLNYVQGSEDRTEIRKLQNSAVQWKEEATQLRAALEVNAAERDMLKINRGIGGSNTGVSTPALREAMEFHRQKLTDLLLRKTQLERNLARTDSLLAANAAQQQTLNGSGAQPSGELVVAVQANAALTSDFTLNYFVQNAGWQPSYDARVRSLDAPLELGIRALVQQQSGEAWPQVKLRLSTGNPYDNGVAPTLQPWNLDVVRPLATALQGRASGMAIEDQKQVEEVVVIGYSAKRSVRSSAAAAPMANVAVTEAYQATTVVYEIAEPYDVPTDGQQYQVQVKTLQLPALYEYVAVPKLDAAAYLTARIPDWQGLNLGDGELQLFLEGSFLGKSRLVTSQAGDTLVLSLGRDKGITVQRNPLKQFTSKQLLSNYRTESRAYELVVRNNKTVPIALVLKDQLPRPINKEVTVEESSVDGAELDAETQALTWRLSIAPRTEVKKQLRYTLRYPKQQRLMLD